MSKVSKTPKKELKEQAVAPQAVPTPATSKAYMMANIVNGMAAMPPAELLPYFEEWMATIGKEADGVPDGAAQKNLASIASTNAVVSEELKEILETESLSEEMKERAAVLFEAAVGAKVGFIKAQLEEESNKRLDEEIDKLNETVLGQIDQYLTYVAEQWVKENKAAVKQSVKTELAESFIRGIYQVFKEHNVSIPEDQIDAVEALTEEIESLRKKLNEQVNENITASKELEKYQKDEVIHQETEGLAMTQVEKIRKLAEGVDFGNDIETFRKKVKVLKESHFPTTGKPKTAEPKLVQEKTHDVEAKVDNGRVTDMKSLARFMSQSVKR